MSLPFRLFIRVVPSCGIHVSSVLTYGRIPDEWVVLLSVADLA